MIISPGRNYIFVHIPKTAGTALTLALESRAMKDDILIADTPKARRRKGRLAGAKTAGRLWKHSTLADIEGLVARDDFARFQIVTLVRNPYDRLVSYYHWLRGQGFDHPAVHLAKGLDFSDFLNAPATVASIQNSPVASYLTDGAGVEHAAICLRLEHLQSDLAPFEAHLGFALWPLDVANTSARRADYRSYYSDADAALVARICAADLARFGYGFDPD